MVLGDLLGILGAYLWEPHTLSREVVSSAPRGSEVSTEATQLEPEGWLSLGTVPEGQNIVDLGLDSRSTTQLRRICFWFPAHGTD